MKAKTILIVLIVTGLTAYYIYTPVPDPVQQKWKVMLVNAFYRSVQNVAESAEMFHLKHYMHVMQWVTDAQYVPAITDENITVTDTIFSGVPVRVYVLKRKTKELRRAIIYIHGGGFSTASAGMKGYDILSRTTATALDAVIVSINYRLAPEHRFPAQFEDAYAVAKYFLQDQILHQYSVDPNRIGVSGDSAGGNLATAVAQEIQADKEVTIHLKVQVLIYPALQALDFNTPSYQQNRRQIMLTKDLAVRYWSEYFATDKDLVRAMSSNLHVPSSFHEMFTFLNWSILLPEIFKKNYIYAQPKSGNPAFIKKYPGLLDSRAAPLLANDEKLRGLPKAYIITCEYDVVQNDGIMYATRLKAAGVQVTHVNYEDGFHGLITFNSWPIEFSIYFKVFADYINWLDTNL
ncbi:arylacetamide deacetylase-like [Protopterus annectens]|uniref:arylacetamide deacetylase-like n=1 Tax=Protopterus annectens TaxID=7888 RepID=UPI001CFB86A7|nr:arylacetamide deacetylase-like [Protopterus annectens]